MRNLTKKEKIIIDVILKFHIHTGVYPTVDQLVNITGFSPKAVISMVTAGYVITEENSNPDVVKFKNH